MSNDRAVPGSNLSQWLGSEYDAMRRFAASKMGTRLRRRLDPTEILHSACIAAVGTFGGRSELPAPAMRAWVRTAIEHAIHRRLRYFAAQCRRSSKEVDVVDSLSDPRPNSDLDLSSEARQIAAAIASLDGDDRRVLLWKIVDDVDGKELAARLGSSVTAARMALSRARARLALRLQDPTEPPQRCKKTARG